MYPVQAYWTSLLVGLFLNDYFHRLMAGFLPNQQCLKTYSDHLWTFDHDSIVWNLSRSFWSSHAQSSWLLISMFTEKATWSLFGSCPLLVVYHSDVSIKTLSDCLSLLTAPFQKRPASPARAPPPTWCATDLQSTDPARKTNSFAGWSKGCQNMFFGGTPYWSNTKTALHIKMKTRFHQKLPFQNRAQDEHHKCHAFGEIYFHWKLDIISRTFSYKLSSHMETWQV